MLVLKHRGLCLPKGGVCNGCIFSSNRKSPFVKGFGSVRQLLWEYLVLEHTLVFNLTAKYHIGVSS